jgi:hypothetical protein
MNDQWRPLPGSADGGASADHLRSGRTEISILFSTKRCAYSDMPSFLSQSAICCIAATEVRSGPDRIFHHGKQRVYTDKSAIARPFLKSAAEPDAGRPRRSICPMAGDSGSARCRIRVCAYGFSSVPVGRARIPPKTRCSLRPDGGYAEDLSWLDGSPPRRDLRSVVMLSDHAREVILRFFSDKFGCLSPSWRMDL